MIKENYKLFILINLIGVFVLSLPACNNEVVPVEEKNGNFLIGNPSYITKGKSKLFQDTSIQFNYPCDIDSVSLVFFHTWSDSISFDFANIPDTSLVNVNHSLGQWLRNNYGLWSRTCLVESFWEIGIFHPDDISAILLTSYHRFLNDRPIQLEEQVKMYKSFWKEEMNIEYKLEDSLSWNFPPSMWDFGISKYD